jgi:hypothetical protein
VATDEENRERRERAYRLVGEIIDGIVAQTCARHYLAPTQEHQFTSKIADASKASSMILKCSA